MRRAAIALLVCLAMLCGARAGELPAGADLTGLTTAQLEAFQTDIDNAIVVYHTIDRETKDIVLATVKAAVEEYFDGLGFDISWAWLRYDYEKQWDMCTLLTHVDYKDVSGRAQKPDVYAELFPIDGAYALVYLLVGTEVVVNRRAEVGAYPWLGTPAPIRNAATGLDLSAMTKEELNALKGDIKDELNRSHKPDHQVSRLVLTLARQQVEAHFAQRNIKVSWAWIDYDYTREWDFYTLTTPIDYRDEGGEKRYATVYAQVYPLLSQYEVCYLSVGEDVLINRRDELPADIAARLGYATEIPGENIQ